ncbi:hypothetical protein [Hyphobacterium sp.]|jgi:hypothetical protein|uniref:hypothetical protein n=1 Tax=Hyphobacterium sp. TaxID=2004662 RepID=UPI003BA9274B
MRNYILSAWAAALIASPALARDDWRAAAAAALPDSGEMHLQMLVDGEADGFMRLGWQRDEDAGLIHFYDRTMWGSQEIFETVEGSVNSETLAPVDIDITFFQQNAILTVNAAARNGVITGGRTFMRPYAGEQSAPIDIAVTDSLIMRGAAFFVSQTLPLSVGESVSFDWFAPLAGIAESVTLTVADGGTIETLSGSHDTIRIEVRGSSTENDIYVTANDGVRQVVRIDVLGQPLRFEAIPAPAGE